MEEKTIHPESAFAQQVNRAVQALIDKGHVRREFENGREVWVLTDEGRQHITDNPETFEK